MNQSKTWQRPWIVPAGSPSRGGDVTVYVWHKPTELAHSFLFCSCDYFRLHGPVNRISFHIFSRQLSAFQLCSSGLVSALLAFSTIHLFMKVFFSPDIIHSGWLGSKHQLINELTFWRYRFHGLTITLLFLCSALSHRNSERFTGLYAMMATSEDLKYNDTRVIINNGIMIFIDLVNLQ